MFEFISNLSLEMRSIHSDFTPRFNFSLNNVQATIIMDLVHNLSRFSSNYSKETMEKRRIVLSESRESSAIQLNKG